ncbi:hypothetical protein FGG08_002336 [Glutinoglossum americanum]|uniref:Uncharacterized protein n=1 Tax=Glutinoglossum americanum TaxID=1670608 RepID=A0A9P8L1U4_9PEZI|nr:hypothetical protein FGG08_002336 [Glutinoglossum americanum]
MEAEVAQRARARLAAGCLRSRLARRAKAVKGLCTVFMGCQNKAVIDTMGFLPSCEEHRKRYYELTARRLYHNVFNTKRAGWGVDVNTPDEMAACLATVPIPPTIVQLCRHIEHQNAVERVFCIDTEFVRFTPKDREGEITIPVEIAVYDLNGEVVIDTLIKYDQPVEELLAGAPHTPSEAKFSWGVAQRIYGSRSQTSGTTIDDIRDTLLNAGMNSNSSLIEWSLSRTDRRRLETIMGEHTPKTSILLPVHWRKVLRGFLSMSLSYFHQFLYPDSRLHKRAHRAGPDTLMLIDTIRALIDLSHRDKELVQSTLDNLIQTNEEILHPQKQLRRELSVNDNHSEDDDISSDNDEPDIESAAKQVVKEITDDDRELLALFEEYCQTQRLAHEATNMIGFHSASTEDQMVGEGDPETLKYLQAFASVQEEQAILGSDNEEFEGLAGNNAEDEADGGG